MHANILGAGTGGLADRAVAKPSMSATFIDAAARRTTDARLGPGAELVPKTRTLSFLEAAAQRATDAGCMAAPGSAMGKTADLSVGPDDTYDYEQHLMPIKDGGVFIARAGGPISNAETTEKMDEDLWALLHEEGDGSSKDAEAEEAFLEGLLSAER